MASDGGNLMRTSAELGVGSHAVNDPLQPELVKFYEQAIFELNATAPAVADGTENNPVEPEDQAKKYLDKHSSSTVFVTVALAIGASCFAISYLESASFEQALEIAQVGILTIGLLSLVALRRQTLVAAQQAQAMLSANKNTREWSKHLSYHQFFGDLVSARLLAEMNKTARVCLFAPEMGSIHPMKVESLHLVTHDQHHDSVVSRYLDEFEEFSAAVSIGVVDIDYAFALEGTRVIRAYTVFLPYILKCRGQNRYTRCYRQLVTLGRQWKFRRDAELQESEQEKNDLTGQKLKLQRELEHCTSRQSEIDRKISEIDSKQNENGLRSKLS